MFCFVGTEIEWVPEERITLFTSDGLVQIGGNMVPRRIKSSNKHGRSRSLEKHQKFHESAYMDPAQGLCLGALFDIAATNVCNAYFFGLLNLNIQMIMQCIVYKQCQGLDMGRRLCIFGFCRSVEMLSDVVEDTVLEHGGEVCIYHEISLSFSLNIFLSN